MKTNINFGENLREFRKKKGYSQEQLAEVSGVSRRMIGHYETLAKCPSLDKINKLAAALNVSIDELMDLTPTVNKKDDDNLSFKLLKKLRVIEKLPKRDQNAIFSYITTVVEKNKLREQMQIQKKKKNKAS